MSRPQALIFQDIQAPSTTPETPDLNTVVVGPAYDVFDYPDDANATLLPSTYGSADGQAGNGTFTPYVPPASGSDTVSVLDNGYPGQSAGSRVDHDSVQVTLLTPTVVMGSTNASIAPALGAAVTTTSSDRTLIELTTPSLSFVAAGIRTGDRIYLTSSASGNNQSITRVVQSVGEPNADGLATTGNENKLRLTQELPASGTGAGQWVYDTGGEIRIERVLATQTLSDPSHAFVTFPEPGTDKMVLKGGVTLPVTITPVASVATPSPVSTSTTRSVSYAKLYLSYRALRQDLQSVLALTDDDVQTVNGIPTVLGIGKIDARNPLAVGVFVALQNAGAVTIYAYGVTSNDAAGHTSARAALDTRSDLYCFVPLTQDVNIHAAYKASFSQGADPSFADSRGRPQKFRICIGSSVLPTQTLVYGGSISGVAQQPSGAASGLYRTLNIDSTSTGAVGVRQVLPGDTLTIGLTPSASTWQNRRGSHKVAHVNFSKDYPNSGDDSVIEITPGSSRWDDTAGASSGDIEFTIVAPDGTVKVAVYAAAAVATGSGGTLGTIRYVRKSLTTVGGPYTIQYATDAAVASPTVAIAGFTITVTVNGTSHTHAQVAAAVNAHAVVGALLTATVTGGGTQVVDPVSQSPSGAAPIAPETGTVASTIVVNDDLFTRLNDGSATFLTNGVKPGDTLQFPADPNNYGPDAFSGQLLSYIVAAVLNENQLLIASAGDDTSQLGRELPHYFSRNYADRYVDNATPNAQSYRLVRALSRDDEILALITVAQSVRDKRLTLVWPDRVTVSDLRDGSLPRASASVRTLAGRQPSFYLAAAVGGAVAGVPPQAGLTNQAFTGITGLEHAQGYYDDEQLTRLSDGGWFVCIEPTPGALAECIHQLTTDSTALETGELSVVKNVDFISLTMQAVLKPFIGRYNVSQETLNEIFRAVSNAAEDLKGRSIAKWGPPLLEGRVESIRVSDISLDRVVLYFVGSVPRPLNRIDFHLVV